MKAGLGSILLCSRNISLRLLSLNAKEAAGLGWGGWVGEGGGVEVEW